MTAPALSEKLDQLPAKPGVYLMKDIAGGVLYVGKATSLRSRVRSYFQPGADLHPRLQSLVHQVHDVDFVVSDSEQEALVLEFSLIQKHRPRYNVRYRDDKSYPYIRIAPKDPFPAVCVVRQHAVLDDGARYFGPYPSATAMRDTIRLVRRLFGVRQRLVASAKKRGGCTWKPDGSPRRRPCLDYYMKLCLAPCVGKVSAEEYRQALHRVCDFLAGRYETVLDKLRREMEQASAELRFENAVRVRDQIEAIESAVGARQRVVSARREDIDTVGYALREDTGCVAVMQIREGRMVSIAYRDLAGVSGIPDTEVLNEFVKHHYQKVAGIPRTVLLPLDIADAGAVEALLSGRRGAAVKLRVPKRGAKRNLLAMAMENAEHQLRARLEQESVERQKGQEAVADLQKALALAMPPRRIEAFDISNIQGKVAVGSMVVVEDGLPKKSDYRRFRVKMTSQDPNDYAMMHEVLFRRLKAAVSGNVKFQRLPDLILVDGGPGQLNVALQAMEALDLRFPVAGLAKEKELLYLPGRDNPIALPAHSRALHLLQRVRDEAHRFALSYHKALRARETRESVLDQVPGIGEKRKQRLLKHFGSVARLRMATSNEIASVAGCSMAVAEDVAGVLAGGNRATVSPEGS